MEDPLTLCRPLFTSLKIHFFQKIIKVSNSLNQDQDLISAALNKGLCVAEIKSLLARKELGYIKCSNPDKM